MSGAIHEGVIGNTTNTAFFAFMNMFHSRAVVATMMVLGSLMCSCGEANKTNVKEGEELPSWMSGHVRAANETMVMYFMPFPEVWLVRGEEETKLAWFIEDEKVWVATRREERTEHVGYLERDSAGRIWWHPSDVNQLTLEMKAMGRDGPLEPAAVRSQEGSRERRTDGVGD